MRASLTACLLAASIVAARADALDDMKIRAVQMATLAKLAPLTCSGLSTDEGAVATFLKQAEVSDDDLDTTYQASMREAAANLATSVSRDRDAACSQLRDQLGDKGMRLLTEDDDDEQ